MHSWHATRLSTALGLIAALTACETVDDGAWQEGDPPLPGLSGGQQSICGNAVDWVDVESSVDHGPFDAAYIAAHRPSTGSLHWNVLQVDDVDPDVASWSGRRWCSGTLIGPDIFLTAAHCFEPFGVPGAMTPQAMCDRMHVDFEYQRVGVPGQPGSVGAIRRFAEHGGDSFACREVLEYGFDDGLDYAILRLDGSPGDIYGFRHVSTDVEVGDDIAIIQHPRGIPKVIDVGTVHARTGATRLRYGDLDTDGGSSGSGVLDREGRLVAVHTNGGCDRDQENQNHGVKIAAIRNASAIVGELLGDDGCVDGDGDGAALGDDCGALDCDDGDPDIAPGRAEICDGIDNDCDGYVDESLPQPRPCISDGDGPCSEGAEQCVDGASVCVPVAEPSAEVCNGEDDDCDGVIDEEINPLAAPIEDRCPTLGICADGRARNVCVDGAWSCRLPPDYLIDECPVTTPACGHGRLDDPSCGDGRDNDCDGVRDEHDPILTCGADPDFDRVGDACFASAHGRCGRDGGTYACVALGEQCGVGVDCVGATFPEAERCDGEDWDCDGHIFDRNDIDGDGYGDCGGRLDCDERRADVYPGAGERCDGVDNDCDGRPDEGVANRCGGCGPEPAELCNRVDDDCDGHIDEGVADCGIEVACRAFSFGSGVEGTISIPAVGDRLQIPLVIVESYDTRGDDDFEYDITPTIDHRAGRVDFAYMGARTNGPATVSGRVCVFGASGPVPEVGGVAIGTRTRGTVRGGGVGTVHAVALPLAGTRQHTFALVESHLTGGDDDFWYSFRAFADPRSPRMEMAGGRAGERAVAAGALINLHLPAEVVVDRRSFVVHGGDRAEILFPRRAGRILAIPAVTLYDSGGDDDAAYSTQCAGAGGQWQCTAAVTGAGERARIEGEFLLISGF